MNCEDTWIICHGVGASSQLHAFSITSTGIDPFPVISDLGYDMVDGNAAGMIKANPVSDQLVMTMNLYHRVELLNFDRSTGVTSINQNLFSGDYPNMPYGIEFSRSGNRLYISENLGTGLFQYDLTASNIPASRTLIAALNVDVGQLQIAPNDKIYLNYFLVSGASSYLGAINNPEGLGVACNFQEHAVSLNGVSGLGLPWYYAGAEKSSEQPDLGPDITVCSGEVVIEAFPNSVPGVFQWSNGSSSSTISVSESGTYWVNYRFESCKMATDTIEVEVDDFQITNPLKDTTGCSGFGLFAEFENQDGLQNVHWNISNGDVVTGPDLTTRLT